MSRAPAFFRALRGGGGGVHQQELWWFTNPTLTIGVADVVELGPVLPEGAWITAVLIEHDKATCPNWLQLRLAIRLVSVATQTYAQVEAGQVLLPFQVGGSRFFWSPVLEESVNLYEFAFRVGGSNRRLAVGWTVARPQNCRFRVGIRYTLQ